MNEKDKTVLVTGAGGFIGSHLVEALLHAGYAVRALVHYNSRGSWGHLDSLNAELRARLEVRPGDVSDPYQMQTIVAGCDTVYHLAALIGIPYSYQAPASYVATNVSGTLNILEAARSAGVRRVIVTSTSEVYGTARYAPIDEEHPLQAQSPYAASKIAADKLAESFYRSFGLPVVVLRPFNTYGPRQSARAVIPTVLSQALSGAPEIVLGNLEPRRDLTFVEDTARAFVLAGQAQGIEGQVIHFGQGSAISVRELAERCLAAAGSRARIVSSSERERPEGSEVELLLCNPAKARSLLGWTPQIPLDEGLRRVTVYMRQNLQLFRPERYGV
jgi:dTDP-glucose 4,6-dehydratase